MKKLLSLSLIVVLVLLAGCTPSDPLTRAGEEVYFRGNVYTWNGMAYQLVNTPVTKVITANSATTSTSLTEIGGLYVTLAANTDYLIEAGWNESVSAVTTGIRYGVGANFTLTSMDLQLTGRIEAATVGMERISANNTATANAFATVSGSTNNAVTISGIVRVGASGGNFSIKHLKVTSGTATALALGWIRATPISVP